jgi:hypothetical protein
MAKCTAPDVCKTPSPGGPVPVPYPVIISMSSDLESGTTTVTADGGNMCAIKGSDFSRCSGDEPGTAGGVKSNVNMKEATWILYSFDVKMDGGNACRKTDKMMMNHENTVCMTGEDQFTKQVAALLKVVAQHCDKLKNDEWDKEHPNGPKHTDCDAAAPGEVWYPKGKYDARGRPNPPEPKPMRIKLGEIKEDCVNELVPDTAERTKQQSFDAQGVPQKGPRKGGSIPDFILHGPGPVKSAADVFAVIDLKFPCPSEAGKDGHWRNGQLEKYMRLFKKVPANRFVLVFP